MPRLPSAERRDLLASAALRVIGAQGLGQATTRAIVAEAGMSLASFHYAFRSRDELLLEVMQRVVDAEMTAAFRVVRPGNDIRMSIAAGLTAFLDYVVNDPGQERALQELVHHAMVTPGLESLARAQYSSYRRAVTTVLDEASRAAGVSWSRPVAEVARFVVTFTDGLTLAWLADRDTAAARRMITLAVDSIAALAISPAAAEPPAASSTSTPGGASA